MWIKKQTTPAAAPPSSLRDEETDDGWVLLPEARRSMGKPPRPPPSRPRPSSTAMAIAASGQPFDPAPEDIVGRYLPSRRALRCGDLPAQIHDADVYGAHPRFLATVYPPANDRVEWFFFACRGKRAGDRRRAGPGAYRLVREARLPGDDAAYCHHFRYCQDAAGGGGSAAASETEWRMDEYGSAGAGDAAADELDMVVCKVYPARGGAVHRKLGTDRAALASRRRPTDAGVKPQVLVELYLASLRLGDPLRCRMHPAADVCAAHPAVLTATLPAANDGCEWYFAAPRAPPAASVGVDGRPPPRAAGPGAYVPVRDCRVVDGKHGMDVGYRRVFLYREDDATARRVARTEWWMEEYGFGPDFPYHELPAASRARSAEGPELTVYKVYLKMAGGGRRNT